MSDKVNVCVMGGHLIWIRPHAYLNNIIYKVCTANDHKAEMSTSLCKKVKRLSFFYSPVGRF